MGSILPTWAVSRRHNTEGPTSVCARIAADSVLAAPHMTTGRCRGRLILTLRCLESTCWENTRQATVAGDTDGVLGRGVTRPSAGSLCIAPVQDPSRDQTGESADQHRKVDPVAGEDHKHGGHERREQHREQDSRPDGKSGY